MTAQIDPLLADEGAAEPLGVSLTPSGVNIAVWAPEAEAVELCLFDPSGETEVARICLPARTGPVWHGHVAGVVAGARYGLRAHGLYEPARGRRFNPHKLLLDPWALAIDRPFALGPSLLGPAAGEPGGFDASDSAAACPKAIVTDLADLAAAPPPHLRVSWAETVLYELHVKGFTRRHPDIPESIRGTFAGLAHPAAVGHLRDLGVTTVELMPAAAWIDERHLPQLGLANYWGYNPVAFLAPDPRLAPGGWREVRAAVETLAAAGIETVLDVVLNHTGESDQLGPTLALRGLDNAGYYRIDPDDPAGYVNDAGTGNVLALDRVPALRLAMDALRAWRRFGGMQGFRFDLATVLGRRSDGFDPHAPLLAAIAQDPDLRALKLIAEPWDVGPGGYQLGAFPHPWTEWNDRWRDEVRGFWRGDAIGRGRLARRLAGSQDVFGARRPSSSVNFVTSHDGFTLADLVAYERKHNEANGEANRDGTDHNLSWNHGVEGPTEDPVILAQRRADQRALLATLLTSRGAPMIAMGAELGHSQQGNNNAYAQDNAASWLDWTRADQDLASFCARLIRIRRDHPALRADRFLTGEASGVAGLPDVEWREPDGAPPTPQAWDDAVGETLVAVFAEPTAAGLDRVVVAIHRGEGSARAVLPEPRDGWAWAILADSADPGRGGLAETEDIDLAPRSVVILAETLAPGRPARAADDETLARLAIASGISLDWTSVDGVSHGVSRPTILALLAAMDLPAATAHQAREALQALAQAQDRRSLPYALVTRAGEAAALPLTVADGEPPPRTWVVIEGTDGASWRLQPNLGSASLVERQARDGRHGRALAVALPDLPAGVYDVRREDAPDTPCRLTVAPTRCFTPLALASGARLWGLSAQLYGLRRERDQGAGDFSSLGDLAEALAERGGAVVAINPLHALFPAERERASPYYPSDRRHLDPIWLDVDGLFGAAIHEADLDALRATEQIDYAAVWRLKARALEAAFRARPQPLGLRSFITDAGEPLARFALFQAIAETRPGEPWSAWPRGLRDASGEEARTFAAEHAHRIAFHQYLQWICEQQFDRASGRAKGLSLGVCRDLAVGAAPDGAELWANAPLAARGVSIGAPPDPFAPQGQVWGLPPYDPHRLRADGYRLHSDLFAANMRHAGALRIDHVMGLSRQFWVPDGADGADGAYVAFPIEDLLGVLALESTRARCLVIGEDLGTVPHGLRERLGEAGVLSYRVLPFERQGAGFTPPAAWPRKALACVATHDLPPLAGWWDGVDIDEREKLALASPDEARVNRGARLADKTALIDSLAVEDLPKPRPDPAGPLSDDLAAAIHAFVAATPAFLALAQAEDLAGAEIAVNLPGTNLERPNWRRRLAVTISGLFDGTRARAILQALRAARPG